MVALRYTIRRDELEQRVRSLHRRVCRIKMLGLPYQPPKGGPRSETRRISLLRRGRKRLRDELAAKPPCHSLTPAGPNTCRCQATSGRNAWRLPSITDGSHREMPSAMELSTPVTCNASNHRPLPTFRHPIRRISAPDRGSSPPRHFDTLCTAAMLSPKSSQCPARN